MRCIFTSRSTRAAGPAAISLVVLMGQLDDPLLHMKRAWEEDVVLQVHVVMQVALEFFQAVIQGSIGGTSGVRSADIPRTATRILASNSPASSWSASMRLIGISTEPKTAGGGAVPSGHGQLHLFEVREEDVLLFLHVYG